MSLQPNDTLHEISDKNTIREFRTRVDTHNTSVLETVRAQVEELEYGDRAQWKNALKVIGFIILMSVLGAAIALFYYRY